MEEKKILKNQITFLPKIGVPDELAHEKIRDLLPTSFIYLQNVRENKTAVPITGKKFYIEVRTSANATIEATLNEHPLKFHSVFGASALYVAEVDEYWIHQHNIVKANIKFKAQSEPAFIEDRTWLFDCDLLMEFGIDKDSLRHQITMMFQEANLKEAVYEKPLNTTGDYSMTGKLIALADAGEISKEQCVTYRDLFERSLPEN